MCVGYHIFFCSLIVFHEVRPDFDDDDDDAALFREPDKTNERLPPITNIKSLVQQIPDQKEYVQQISAETYTILEKPYEYKIVHIGKTEHCDDVVPTLCITVVSLVTLCKF